MKITSAQIIVASDRSFMALNGYLIRSDWTLRN